MLKKIICLMILSMLILTGCSNDVSKEKYDSLVAENEQLKQKLSQYEKQTTHIPNSDDNEDNTKPATSDDFIYVNNGNSIQINGYKGNGGIVKIPSEIDGVEVVRIAPEAFKDATSITGIVLPERLQYIGDNAFYGLKELSGIVIVPNTTTEIGGHAFQSTQITGLVIKSNCKINVNAFANINSLEFIYVGDGCAPQIGTAAFGYSKALAVAVFPDSLTNIKDRAFEACNNLTIYTPSGSYAETYANKNYISVDTSSYVEQIKIMSGKY